MQPKLPFLEITASPVPQWERLEENQRKDIVERLARLIEKAMTSNEQEKENNDG